MKQATLVAAVDARIDGVRVFGDRGTGESTAVHALAALLPPMRAVAGCRYRYDLARLSVCEECLACGVVAGARSASAAATVSVAVLGVDLPLGATENRVVGALGLECPLAGGVKAFKPGLLACAHRGFLYINEVNPPEDHLVDLLIDVAALGENVVERYGLSVRHPAHFVVVRSGNPEEGELRLQLLDRFGLSVEVRTSQDLSSRVEVVKRRDAFERDPQAFGKRWAKEEMRVRRQIVVARARPISPCPTPRWSAPPACAWRSALTIQGLVPRGIAPGSFSHALRSCRRWTAQWTGQTNA